MPCLRLSKASSDVHAALDHRASLPGQAANVNAMEQNLRFALNRSGADDMRTGTLQMKYATHIDMI